MRDGREARVLAAVRGGMRYSVPNRLPARVAAAAAQTLVTQVARAL